jgi:NAD(P)-dependent dehydrogenase (short-subunit alcohol dehydrogenase family)
LLLTGKNAVITGGGTGIGLSIARALAEQGCNVAITGRRLNVLEEAAEPFGGQAVKMDVSDEASVVTGMQSIADHFGSIDICVANAGIAEGQNIRNSSFDFWRKIMAINLDGAYLTIRESLSHMPVQEWGRVLAVSSIAGVRGLKGAHAYSASKHGVIGMIRALCADHAKLPVTFNAICPGYVDTDIIDRNTQSISERAHISQEEARALMVDLNPHGRLITADEVASAALWICGPGSDSFDGQAMEISGGQP